MEKDLTLKEAWLKETCRELYLQSLMAEQINFNKCDFHTIQIAEEEIAFKTKFALQIITGCDEVDAMDLVNEISGEEIQRIFSGRNTEDARKHLQDSFNFDLPDNNEET